MSAVVPVLVVHYRDNPLGMEPVSSTESGHSRSQDDNIWHRKYLSCFSRQSGLKAKCSSHKRLSYRSTCISVKCRRSALPSYARYHSTVHSSAEDKERTGRHFKHAIALDTSNFSMCASCGCAPAS